MGEANLGPARGRRVEELQARSPSAGVGKAEAVAGGWQSLGADVWDSTEKLRRCPEGSRLLAADELWWNLGCFSSDQCLSLQSPDSASAVRPQPLSQEGALSGVGLSWAGVEAAGPERANSAHAQKSCCRFQGCRKARGQRRLRPRASASLPRPDPGLLGHPRARGGSAPRKRAQTATRAGTPSPESREAFSRGR